MNVAGQHGIREAARLGEGSVKRVENIGRLAVGGVERERRVVHGDDQFAIRRSILERRQEEVLLAVSAASVQTSFHIRVQPDNSHEWCIEDPVHIRLGHAHAIRRDVSRGGIAEVIEEPGQRRLGVGLIALAYVGISVVIDRNGEDQRRIVLKRLIEFGLVEPAFNSDTGSPSGRRVLPTPACRMMCGGMGCNLAASCLLLTELAVMNGNARLSGAYSRIRSDYYRRFLILPDATAYTLEQG